MRYPERFRGDLVVCQRMSSQVFCSDVWEGSMAGVITSSQVTSTISMVEVEDWSRSCLCGDRVYTHTYIIRALIVALFHFAQLADWIMYKHNKPLSRAPCKCYMRAALPRKSVEYPPDCYFSCTTATSVQLARSRSIALGCWSCSSFRRPAKKSSAPPSLSKTFTSGEGRGC